MNAYTGKLLIIDLTDRSSDIFPVPDAMKQAFIGGKGYGARLLCDWVPPGTDPLGPENPIMFLTGPLTGTLAPAMRGCIITRSPLTGLFLDSYFGGSFSPEIKYAGYDGIVIKGRADAPSYIWIDDETVEIRDARHLWGTDALTANQRIKEDLGDDTVRIASIGQAGENQVLFSLVSCEFNRQAGRGGAGAVMGAKNLKAIAVRGGNSVKVHDPQGFSQACKNAFEELRKSPDVEALRVAGTASAVEFANETGLLPNKNYKNGTFAKASKIADKGQSKHLWLGSSACLGCPIRCSKIGAVRTGKFKGFVTDIIEYESAALLGANLDISDIRAVAHLTKLCDLYGMDSMSSGNLIGFAMEACETGLIKTPKGIDLTFGNVEAAEYLIHDMAGQKSELGRLLSKGVKQAAKEIGDPAEAFAVHTKGLETPAWGPRGVSGMGLAYMTTDRGGCHQRGFTVSYELGGEYNGVPMDPLTTENKARMVVELQNYSAGTDTLVKCDFGSFGISDTTYAQLLTAAVGGDVQPGAFYETGERIWNLVRMFNLANGTDESQDTLPARFVKEALPDGPAKGHLISERDMARMKQEYYDLRGWDKSGTPLKETLARLGLEDENTNQ
ncbi:MAG: aldehyde ferredoxin oxidoreductase [Desulfobacteraceae bacterium]|mgnify:CR=1 FL=1|nr:MAG: aldehyde ferredoxin oxidoreductase [Desulfobacteraceae bacterium]